MIKVSIIIPVYNVEGYLRQCLDSVLNQTLRDIEIICVDDGSTDGSSSILASYANRDPRIVLLSQPCSGAGSARNLGMSRARGQYIDFVDSDDFIAPDMLERRFACAEETQADIVVSGFCRYDASGSVLQRRTVFGWAVSTLPRVFSPDAFANSIFTTFNPAPWNKFFRADFIFRNRLQFQALPRCNDVCFTQTALALASRLTVLDESGYGYREGRLGSAQNTTAQDSTCVCRAYSALRENLHRLGMYRNFRKSFCRAVFSSSVMTLSLLDNPKDAEGFYHALHSGPFSDLFSDRLSESDFNTDANTDAIDYKRYCVFCTNTSLSAFLIVENEWLHVLLRHGDNRLMMRTKELVERNQLITAKDARIDDLENRIKVRTKEVVERNQLITAKDARIDDLENRIKVRTKEVVERNQLITAKDARIDDLESRVKQRTREVVERNQLIVAKDARIDDLENRIKARTKEVVERNQLIVAKDARIDDLENRIKARTKEVVERNQLIVAKDARIDDLESRVKQRTQEVVERNQLIAAKDARIDVYVRQLADLRSSLPYRLGRFLTWPMRKMRNIMGVR